MNIVMGKPLNVQFEIKEDALIDQLRDLAREVGDIRGDRRLGSGAIAKELVIRILKSGRARSMLGIEELSDFPKDEAQRSGPRKKAA